MDKQSKKLLTPSMEDYMEMIYRSCLKEGYVRINHLARQLNVQASSASKIVQKLARFGLLNYQKYGIIRLTEKGEEIGEFLLNRHETIETFLRNMGVKDNILKDTEMMEHNISTETLENIRLLNKFLERNPSLKQEFNRFKNLYGDGG